jgi:methylmalonyl-CoA mutase
MSEKLFSEFSPTTKQQWKQQVLKELKGKPYDSLIWNKDGIDIEPYYTKEETQFSNFPPDSYRDSYKSWQIRQDFAAADFKNTNRKILKALENGVEAIGLRVKEKIIAAEMEQLLEGVFLDMVSIHFVADVNAASAFDAFVAVAEKRNYDLKNLQGSFDTDPLCKNETPDFADLKSQLEKFADRLPQFKLITLHIQETGNDVDDLVSALKKAAHYFSELSKSGYDKEQLAKQMQFFIPVGLEYFIEIGKLRAMRILWSKILSEHSVKEVPAVIHAQKSWKHNDETDPYKNILRHTTEAMSAVIGGCDVLSLRSIDKTETFSNDFFERVSVNIQHILKNESHFDRVADPAAGSYYIETLTQKITEAVESKIQK